MAEGVIYEGMGRPTPGPVEWVKQKLAARYTEKGRIQQELNKVEKVMGPLTQEQRAEAAEKMHLEGKIKNKVVATVVTDAVVGTVVVGTAVYLGKRPDVRGNIAAFMSRNTKTAGVAVSENLNAGIAKLKPLDGQNQGLFKRLLTSMMTGVDTVVTKSTSKAGELFDKAAQASVRSTTGRVINAEKAAMALTAKYKGVAPDKIPASVKRAADNLFKWETREAGTKLVADSAQEFTPEAIKSARELGRKLKDYILRPIIANNRASRPVEAAKRVIARRFNTKDGVKPFQEALNAAREAFTKLPADATPEARKIAVDAGKKAYLEFQASQVLAKEAADRAAGIAVETARKQAEVLARKAKLEAEKLARKIKVTPAAPVV